MFNISYMYMYTYSRYIEIGSKCWRSNRCIEKSRDVGKQYSSLHER